MDLLVAGEQLLIEVVPLVQLFAVRPRVLEGADAGKLLAEELLDLVHPERVVWSVRRLVAQDLRVEFPERLQERLCVPLFRRRLQMPLEQFAVDGDEALDVVVREMPSERERRLLFDAEQIDGVVRSKHAS